MVENILTITIAPALHIYSQFPAYKLGMLAITPQYPLSLLWHCAAKSMDELSHATYSVRCMAKKGYSKSYTLNIN